MSQEELDRAAHDLIRSSVHGGIHPSYIDQRLGGYKGHEMKDLNQFSRSATPTHRLRRQPHLPHPEYIDDYHDSMDDRMVKYVLLLSYSCVFWRVSKIFQAYSYIKC